MSDYGNKLPIKKIPSNITLFFVSMGNEKLFLLNNFFFITKSIFGYEVFKNNN